LTRAGRILRSAGIVFVFLIIAFLGRNLFRGERGGTGTGQVVDEGIGIGMQAVTLYFADPERADLATERRDLIVGAETSTLVAAALEALARGPEGRLARIVPDGTRVRHVFIDRDGVVYADFSAELSSGMAGAGLSQEILLLRSFARTLSVNFRSLKSLVILVEGRTKPSLGGRIDTSQPLDLVDWQ